MSELITYLKGDFMNIFVAIDLCSRTGFMGCTTHLTLKEAQDAWYFRTQLESCDVTITWHEIKSNGDNSSYYATRNDTNEDLSNQGCISTTILGNRVSCC
jgi:hypothetical protein